MNDEYKELYARLFDRNMTEQEFKEWAHSVFELGFDNGYGRGYQDGYDDALE